MKNYGGWPVLNQCIINMLVHNACVGKHPISLIKLVNSSGDTCLRRYDGKHAPTRKNLFML